MPLGILNRDVIDTNFCSEYLKSTNYQFNTSICTFEHLSCYFLNEIDDESIKKVYYKTFDEAFSEARAAKTFGFISISSNFTEVLSERKFDWQPIAENFSYSNQISVYLDHTYLQFSVYIKNKLWKTFINFNKKMLQHCELDERLEDFPLQINTFYGELDDDHVMLMYPGLISLLSIQIFFFFFKFNCKFGFFAEQSSLVGSYLPSHVCHKVELKESGIEHSCLESKHQKSCSHLS